jgi:AAA15 family ATPase/GTPase
MISVLYQSIAMNVSQQRVHALKITKLKCLNNLEISFEDKSVTAILGPNGNGKSTILHALACCYSPITKGVISYRFSDFFLPNPHSQWQGSELKLTYSYRNNQKLFSDEERSYSKLVDRWKPIYDRRPKRDLFYIGIDKCVPLIESEKRRNGVSYTTNQLSGDLIDKLLRESSFIFNRKYTSFNEHNESQGKKYIGVESGGTCYSALSMSAGEQKVFHLLELVFKASKYSLILVDELDLLLHDDALRKLIEVLVQEAEKKKLQIICTTHREAVLDLSHILNVRHIHNTNEKTYCFNETKPDAIYRLTGKKKRQIEVFVEDKLSAAIVKKISGKLKLNKHIDIRVFGAASNCFTVLGGLLLKGEDCTDMLFVLDGDVYRTIGDREEQLKKVISGTDQLAKSKRNQALLQIRQLILPTGRNPERYLHELLLTFSDTDNEEFNEIIEASREIRVVGDNHRYIDNIVERLNYNRDTGISKIMDLLSMHDEWHEVYPIV